MSGTHIVFMLNIFTVIIRLTPDSVKMSAQCGATDMQNNKDNVLCSKQKRSSRLRLYFTVFTVNCMYLTCGCIAGWTSPTLAKLQAPGSWLPVSDAEASWILSLLPMGALIGPLLGGGLIDLIGRKRTMLFIITLFITSWVLLFFAKSIYLMYAARFIFGIGDGATFVVIPIYIAEISEDSVRSAVNTLLMLFVYVGILVMYCIGPFVSYHLLIKIAAIPSFIFLAMLPWLPESPYYLVSKNKVNKAVKNLVWLRGDSSETYIEQEMSNIKMSIVENASNKGTLKDLFSSLACRRGLAILCCLLLLQQISCITMVVLYAESLFKITGTAISTSASSIIVSVVNVVVAVLNPPIINHFGYRKPLIFSASGMFFSQSVLGVYLFLATRNYDVLSFNWIPLVCIAACFVAFGSGFSTVPWALLGELFPQNVKGIAAGIGITFCATASFLNTKLFSDIVNTFGIDFAFGVFSLASLISIFFILFILPETNGLSLVEIQELLNDPNHMKNKKVERNKEFLPNELKPLE